MPSRVRSLPLGRLSGHEINLPGTIVDVSEADKRRSSTFSQLNRRSADYSIRSSRSSKSSQESLVASSGSLSVQIESPPLVCYGPPSESTGALLSGQLWLEMPQWDVELDSLRMTFQVVMSTKKPVMINCPECTSRTTDLHSWEFISGVHPVSHGSHNFPFSYLVPGHLAASTDGALGSIKYQLYARGITVNGELLETKKTISISRAIIQGDDRHSLRVFPPTNISANLTLPSVIHRGGDFPIDMRLEGICVKENNTRWKLRKVSWRLEEKSKIVSPACKAHAHKIGGEGKGVQYEDVKLLSSGEFKNGWKNDFSGEGKAEFEFSAGIPASVSATDDVENTNGLSISHNLVLEMIVAEEYVPKNTKMVTPTGSARVLRMQFGMVTTARSGMGIAWDDECPPTYENVPSSPPIYQYDSELSEEFALL